MADEYRFIFAEREGDVDVLTVRLQRIADFEIAHELGNELVSAVRRQAAGGVVVDMRNVDYLASVGFGPLISLRSCVKEMGRRLILCNLAAPLQDVLTATRVLINPHSREALFEYADTRDAAIHVLNAES